MSGELTWLTTNVSSPQYCNDSTLKNVHWALCTGVFGKRDVGRIEREFLDVLDYELGLTEADLLSHHDAIMSLTQAQRVRFHQRSHAVSAPASPQRHHHHHQAQPVRVKLTPPSRWSNGSDMSDSDDSLSSTMSPPPQTPEMDVDAPPAPSAAPLQGGEEEGEEDNEADFPEVRLEELLEDFDEMTLGAEEGEEA